MHFANSAVHLLRALGIPSRVGAGFAVAESERQGGSSLLLMQHMAHAWPEVYVEGEGWMVADVYPERSLEPPFEPGDVELARLLGEMARGEIPPSEFIGVAEQTDLIGPITELVLRAATTGMITAGAPSVKLAVNVSARSLQDPVFSDDVLRVLQRSGFPADRLELEVTERAIVTNVERSAYTIERLRHAGVRIAIDDFGVGYSSYQTLRLLDVDRVKIDRDLVANLTTEARDRLIVAGFLSVPWKVSVPFSSL